MQNRPLYTLGFWKFSISILCLTTLFSCKTLEPLNTTKTTAFYLNTEILVGADQPEAYIPLLKGLRVGILTNQTGRIVIPHPTDTTASQFLTSHIVDYLHERKEVNLVKIFAPEHGFRGEADAGELIADGKDIQTGLPIVSLYGSNKKPTAEQLQDIDILLFDLQDVGARFYTYISSLHYVMEACAENQIPLIVLDRPNPKGNTVDGPILEMENWSFVGMHPIPVLHGMTIGEYAQMINGEGWLKNKAYCNLYVIPCKNYNKKMPYNLPVRPSPNLPNAQSIALYPSLCFFEGTPISLGRGTDMQFQIYGAPELTGFTYSFTPQPNFGSKNPPQNGNLCYGENLSQIKPPKGLSLEWLLKAYEAYPEKDKFFTNFFIKLAGTAKLQQQIEAGLSEKEIRASWEQDLRNFKKLRKDYELY